MENNGKLIAAGLALAVAVTAGVMFVLRKPDVPPPAPVAPAPPPPPPPKPAGPPEPPPLALPELGQSDDFIRDKAKGLSGDARLVAWLKVDNLIRRLTAAVDMIAAGKVPSDSFSALGPRKRFAPAWKNRKRVIDPKSYARYDAVGGAFESLDAKATATLFKQTKPLFQAACQELGYGNCDFQENLIKATKVILQAPILDGDVRLKEKDTGICYALADDGLEHLNAVQKQLIRMGPRNTEKIQGKLRDIVGALGVPASQLAAPAAP